MLQRHNCSRGRTTVRYRLLTASLALLFVISAQAQTPAAVTAHGQSDHGKKLIAALGDMLDGRPDALRLVLISAKN